MRPVAVYCEDLHTDIKWRLGPFEDSIIAVAAKELWWGGMDSSYRLELGLGAARIDFYDGSYVEHVRDNLRDWVDIEFARSARTAWRNR